MTPELHEPSDFAPTVPLDLNMLPATRAPGHGRQTVAAAPIRAMPAAALPALRVLMPPEIQVPALAVEPFRERALRLFVRGFDTMEQKLLEGTVRLSQRRLPRLELVPEDEAATVDLVMIDGSDDEAVAWGESQRWLADKVAIWVDSRVERPGHTLSRRPVQWSILPMMLARALEQASDSGVPSPESSRQLDVNHSPRPAGTTHILVVDDSLAVRNHLRSLLEARGLQVSEADCVKAALEAVATNRFACVLMDVLMPDMDGYEGCKRIKSLKSSIGVLPVVMLTSKSSPFDRIRGKMAGCDAYLTKPVAPGQLYELLSVHTGVGGSAVKSEEARAARPRTDATQFRSAAAQRA